MCPDWTTGSFGSAISQEMGLGSSCFFIKYPLFRCSVCEKGGYYALRPGCIHKFGYKCAELNSDDFSHLLWGINTTVFKPRFGDRIDTISKKERLIVSSGLADA